MELKCKINRTVYENVVQGEAFAEEYNETLDSGSLIISHQRMIRDLKPYDDVYIWDSDYEFLGFDKEKLFMKKDNIEYTYIFDWDNREFVLETNPSQKIFFKHLLVSNFTEKMINLRDFTQTEKGVGNYTPIYEYTIQLFSETKGAEKVQVPNISITEPLNHAHKVSVYEYMRRYISLYSPVYKKVKNKEEKIWEFEKKYSLSPSLEVLFKNVYSPDFSFSGRTLKDLLNKLMSTKDMTIYIMNNVIYAMDITKRRGEFVIDEHINYISGSMSSNDYCDNLRRNYSNAISKNNSASVIEYLGFRNNDNALMTLANMRLETRFPIYKINKMYMCYYKQGQFYDKDGSLKTKIFLCKQDITPLVKLGTERNVLSQDWSDLEEENPTTAEKMAKYKMCTVEYNIGSKYITGWGEMYTYPQVGTFWDITKNYLQTIFEKLDVQNPFGIYGGTYVKNLIGYLGKYNFNTVSPLANVPVGSGSDIGVKYIGDTLKMKTFIFEIDYQAFYNGSIIHSKDLGRDNIVINDNPEEPLSLLESDGVAAKEKINRFGNKGITISARYDDISQMQPLGSVFHDFETADDDIIIYHREYKIFDNYITCVYYGMHDYVLKNFYTSVYARHRTWNLMPYGEATTRSENRKNLLLLSKKSLYWENINDEDISNHKFLMTNFSENNEFIKLIFSAFNPNTLPYDARPIERPEKFNTALIKYYHYDENDNAVPDKNKYYLSDLNSFVSGNSMCFNITMPDNISGGNYIYKFRPNYQPLDQTMVDLALKDSIYYNVLALGVENDYTGSVQQWEKSTDDYGFAKKMGFYLACYHKINETAIYDNASDVQKLYDNYLFNLPYIRKKDKDGKVIFDETKDLKNKIGNDFEIYKDNKEVIDMTYQIEPITTDKDIHFSSWLMQLSDLITNCEKFEDKASLTNEITISGNIDLYFGTYYNNIGVSSDAKFYNRECKRRPYVVVKIAKNLFSEFAEAWERTEKNAKVEHDRVPYHLDADLNSSSTPNCIIDYELNINSIKCFYDNKNPKISLDIKEYINIAPAINRSWTQYRTITLSSASGFSFKNSIEKNEFSYTNDYYYFVHEEFPMTFVSPAPVPNNAYDGFAAQIDWQKDNKVVTGYDIRASVKYANIESILNENCINRKTVVESVPYTDPYKKFQKSMCLCISKEEKINKDIIYEKFGYIDEYDSEVTLYKKGDLCLYNGNAYIYKSEDAMNSPGKFNSNNWTKINHAVIKNNLYKITPDVNFWKNIDFELTEKPVSQIFSINKENNGGYYINVDLNSFEEKPASVQYWFMENGTINFVFGVNVSDDDWDNKNIKIYVSSLTTRDPRVYDEKNNFIGNIVNFYQNEKPYGVDQFYEEFKEQ